MHRWLVVLLLYSACAFGIKAPDPDRPRSRAPECDTGKGAVLLDGAMAALSGVIAVSVVEEEPAVALLPLGIGALYLAGAIKGNSNANKCREAIGEYEQYMAGREITPVDDERLRRLRVEATAPEGDPVPASAAHASRPVLPAPAPAPVAAPVGAQGPVAAPMQAPAPVPLAAPTPAPVAVPAPAPVAKAPPAKASPAKAPTKAVKPAENDWSDFWREVE